MNVFGSEGFNTVDASGQRPKSGIAEGMASEFLRILKPPLLSIIS